ncbi:MAG: hypothetical protein V1744_01310 [Candidatus Altiarchaeota archaeon]
MDKHITFGIWTAFAVFAIGILVGAMMMGNAIPAGQFSTPDTSTQRSVEPANIIPTPLEGEEDDGCCIYKDETYSGETTEEECEDDEGTWYDETCEEIICGLYVGNPTLEEECITAEECEEKNGGAINKICPRLGSGDPLGAIDIEEDIVCCLHPGD